MFQMSTSSPPGLESFTLPVWLIMNDPGQDPGAYLHIHSALARRIRGGEYPAGARLPTETELADEFGCGPGTAARALRALQRDGLARKVLRRGYESSGPDAHPG
jgi:DNA-binding transcriptional regulator YhcF (GntR family)